MYKIVFSTRVKIQVLVFMCEIKFNPSFLLLPRRHAQQPVAVNFSTTTPVKTAWKYQFSSRHLSFKTRGRVYSSCVQSAMLHASETWPLTKPNLQRLQRNDRAIIREICNVKLQDIVTTRSIELLAQLGIEDMDLILKERRLRWYGRGALQWCSQDSLWHTGWWKAWAWEAQDDMEAADRDYRELWKLSAIDPRTWRPCMQQASYPEGGPLMWMLPLYLHVNQKSEDDDVVILTMILHWKNKFSVYVFIHNNSTSIYSSTLTSGK